MVLLNSGLAQPWRAICPAGKVAISARDHALISSVAKKPENKAKTDGILNIDTPSLLQSLNSWVLFSQ